MELSSSKIRKLLIFWEIELSSAKIKTVLIFSPKKLFLYFGKQNFLKKTSYISRRNFLSSKNNKKTILKKFLIFWETEILVFSWNYNTNRNKM